MIDKGLLTSLLVTLNFAGGPVAIAELRRDLERQHSRYASAAALRGALALLEQAGLVRLREDRALITEAGADIANLRAPLPDLV